MGSKPPSFAQILGREDLIKNKKPGGYQAMDSAIIKFKKKPCRLIRWDYPVIESPVTYNGRDSYYRAEPLRRLDPEHERPADKPKPACRRPGRSRRVV